MNFHNMHRILKPGSHMLALRKARLAYCCSNMKGHFWDIAAPQPGPQAALQEPWAAAPGRGDTRSRDTRC